MAATQGQKDKVNQISAPGEISQHLLIKMYKIGVEIGRFSVVFTLEHIATFPL